MSREVDGTQCGKVAAVPSSHRICSRSIPGERAVSIKDILVHVDDTRACEERVRLTMRLATRFGASVTGILVLPSPAALMPPDDGATAVTVATWLAELEGAAEATGQEFLDRLSDAGLDGHWHLERGDAAFNIARRGRAMDLVVVGQHNPDLPNVLTAPEDVVLSCGLPVLVVPFAGQFDDVGENAFIAWNSSSEAARSVHDALPLLMPRRKVTVVSINPDANDEEIRDDLVGHLVRHGVDTEVETHVTKELSPAELMLSLVADSGSDLIVMGAYGHSRLREAVLGGMTHDMLRSMTVPVLMAH
jgi:nucleotide-binding universal stress UspA family protein